MSPSPSVSEPAAADSQSYPVHVDAGLLSPFSLKRAGYFLLVPLPLLGLCMHLGQGVLGLALMVVSSWPFRPRCQVEPGGIRISWLFLKEVVPWEEIAEVELADDRRRGVIGRRTPVLTIERRGKPRITLRARDHVLARLTADLARRPHAGDHPHRS